LSSHGVILMISYSKIFKASQLSVLDEVKVISQPQMQMIIEKEESGHSSYPGAEADFETTALQEARKQAQAIIEAAEKKARAIEEEAQEKINRWWQENEQKLEVMRADATNQGYEEGYIKGKLQAEEELREQYQAKFDQVQQLIDLAYRQKEEIIAEAEPFLLELSSAIAMQIVRQELESYPEKFVQLIQQHIMRFKEKEHITICVHPDDFEFIQSQRAHIVSVVNGETEIKIIPDHSVTPKGVVIRTAYGSIDARIDTQIEEIKKAISEVGREKTNASVG
jgi:flagellar assembly protein FliH